MTRFSKEALKELRLFHREKQTRALPGLSLKGKRRWVGSLRPLDRALGPTAACDCCGIFAFVGPFLQGNLLKLHLMNVLL